MTKTRTWTSTFAIVCAVVVLDSCKAASEPSLPGATSGQASPSGAAGTSGSRLVDSKLMMPNAAGSGASADSRSKAKGSPGGSNPEGADSGVNMRNGDAKASPHPSMSDASVAPGRGPAVGDSGTAPADMSTSTGDAGAGNTPDAGATSGKDKQQPEAAGAESTTPVAGALGEQTPMAGAESMMPPECKPVFPGATCNAAPQCGCEQGENCAYLSLEFPTCLRPGSGALNQRCSLATDCQIGLQCVEGACLKLCDPNEPECGDEVACNQNFSSLDRPIPGYFTCSSNCNLVDPQRATDTFAACGGGLTCLVFGKGTDCVRSGTSELRHGEPCEYNADCAAGYRCTDNGTCARWCETEDDCPDGYLCDGFDVTVRDTRFGTCRPTCGGTRELACEVDGQCGCEGTMACDFFNQDGRFIHGCRPTGRAAPYARCDEDADCGEGYSCISGKCAPFCERDTECGGNYASCAQVTDGSRSSSPPIPGFNVCSRPCDPADLTRPHGPYESCPEGSGCVPTTTGVSYCRQANENGVGGAACSSSSDCAVGYECSSNYGCIPQCRTNAECSAGYNCAAFDPHIFADVEEWGVCIPAPPSNP